jgi:DNA-binding XRE family transcriptional regulator
MDAKELGKRVRAARAYAGLSNAELAERIEIGRSTLVKVEAGRRRPKAWELWVYRCGLRCPAGVL